MNYFEYLLFDRWEIVGLIGALTYTSAYILAAYDILTSKSRYYYLLNLIAALLVLCSLYMHYNLASVVIQIFFASVSLVGMWRHPKFAGAKSYKEAEGDQKPYSARLHIHS